MSDIPVGLTRWHKWYPHPDAIAAAVAEERHMSADDYIDRYLTRVSALAKQPSSGEWLTWFIDDNAKAKQSERAAARAHLSDFDDTGTPRTWRSR